MFECIAEPVTVVTSRQVFAEPFGSVLEDAVLDIVDFGIALDLTCLGVDNHGGDGAVSARIGELVENVMLVIYEIAAKSDISASEDMERSAGRDVYAQTVGDVRGVSPDGIAGIQEHVLGIIERMDIGRGLVICPVRFLVQTVVPPGVYIYPY